MGHTMWLEPLIIMGVIKPVNDLTIWGLVIQSDGLPNFTFEFLPSGQIPPHHPLFQLGTRNSGYATCSWNSVCAGEVLH